VLVASVVGSIALGGFTFSVEALVPKFERLDPIAGFKRVSGPRLTEAKALREVAVVARSALIPWHLAHDFLEPARPRSRRRSAARPASRPRVLVGLSATLVLIAAADVPLQYWQHRRALMTKQEARDEQETEGRPEVRSRLRQP
jgi:flagellar biosynthetic protein FlhB